MTLPERFGKYQVTGVLGEGAMGVVYRGYDPDIRRVVALKTIRRQAGQSPESAASGAARFRNEAQAAGRLLHPGIVGVYDFGDDGRVAYIAMEYVEGHTLAAYVSHFAAQQMVFSDADLASVATQLLEALGHAHEHGVWHRDVKPSNVIMTKSGRIKIADFGIARTDNNGLTMTGGVVGTPMYMAPEQFTGTAIDHRVDIYAAGVLLYQLIAGRPPFGGTPEALMYKVVHEPPPAPSAAEGPERTQRFDAVVAQALAKDPAGRFASAAVFRDAVAAAYGQALPAAVSTQTVKALDAASGYAPTERLFRPPSQTGSTATPTHWDAAVLSAVEAALARHLGPMARVLVRRAARECHDLPALHARLAEQITQTAVRDAFLQQVHGSVPSTGGRSNSSGETTVRRPSPGAGSPGPTGGSRAGPPVSDALLEQAQRLLAAHVGPIARVVVKRSAERTRQREALFALLVEAVPEAARAKLLAELSRLP